MTQFSQEFAKFPLSFSKFSIIFLKTFSFLLYPKIYKPQEKFTFTTSVRLRVDIEKEKKRNTVKKKLTEYMGF